MPGLLAPRLKLRLAGIWGATVIGTASEKNHEYLRSLNAIPVTYGEGLVDRVRAIAPDGPTAALDAAGMGGALEASIELVGDPTRIATIADTGPQRLEVLAPRTVASAQVLTELAGYVATGQLHVEIAAEVPLAEAAGAHRLVESGHTRGKVVLVAG